MTLDNAIKHCEEVAIEKCKLSDSYSFEEHKCGEEHRQLAEWLKELKQLREQTRWIPVSERLPMSDEEYHTFLVTDSKGNVALSEFYLSISDKKPYWSGMIDVKAWMPLPELYRRMQNDE